MQARTSRVIEWVIVICFIAIVASIIIPSAITPRHTPRRVMCMNNLRQIGQACVMYAQDYGGYYPTVREEGTTNSRPMASLALLYDKYVSTNKIFACRSAMDSCADLQPGQTFLPHARTEQEAQSGERRRCSYAYDDTRAPQTSHDIVIAGDAPSSQPSADGKSRNSDNHFGDGQNVLFYGATRVLWIERTENPKIPGDDIYSAADPKNPGASDSYIHE